MPSRSKLFLSGTAAVIAGLGAVQNLSAQSPATLAEIEVEVSWILDQRSFEDSEELFQSYVGQLSSSEIPAALAAFGKIDTRDVVDGDLHQVVLARWAARDPEAAFGYIRPMFRAVTSDHFLDQWEEKELIPHRELLKTLPFMPQSRDLPGLLDGLFASAILRERKEAIYGEFVQLFQPFRDEWKIPSVEELDAMSQKPWAASDSYPRVKEIRQASLERIPKLYHAYPKWRHITLQRWVEIGAKPPLLPLWLASSGADDTAAVLAAWAEADAEGLWSFVREFRPDDWAAYAGAPLCAHVDEARRGQIFAAVPREQDTQHGLTRILLEWGTIDPEGAFHAAEEMLEDDDVFGEFARDLFYSRRQGPHERRVARVLMDSGRQVNDENAYVIMEEFGDLDVALASQYGVDWHLKQIAAAAGHTAKERESFAYYPKDHLIRVWSGKEDPEDGCMDDRTFGCLRKWAACVPGAMKEWVSTLEDAEIKAALLWMADHPNR